MSSIDLWPQVLAAPNDAELRAQYVDALFKEGDRRAEPFLVGAEIERRKRNREGHLTQALAKHYEQLTRIAAQEFAGFLEHWRAKLTFVFGWPSEITISAAEFIRHAAEIAATIPLRHLNLLSINDAPEAGVGYDGITGFIVMESIYLPEFGRELESAAGPPPIRASPPAR